MSAEKPHSIMCETCGGWHTTEAHAQYEKIAREKRMAEIKARPDEAYHFDTLGFTPEQKGEIEPWMHEVIEKAKDLGDDLQDNSFYIHFGPVDKYRKYHEIDVPSVLSMITQKSFAEHERVTHIAHHEEGKPMAQKEVWHGATKIIGPILELQERWVQTRDEQELKKYQLAIRKTLHAFLAREEDRIPYIERDMREGVITDEKYRDEMQAVQKRIEGVQRVLAYSLDEVNERSEAMDFIAQEVAPSMGIGHETHRVGIIFKVGDSLYSETTVNNQQRNPLLGNDDGHSFIYGDQEVLEFRGWSKDFEIYSKNAPTEEKFYKKFIHAIYVPGGSVSVQRDIMQRMLEMTTDHPELRLPIYNFYGKLVWPRPPEENK